MAHIDTRHENPGDQGTSNLPDESSEDTAQGRMRHYFETDASEVEDLNDSTGVNGLPDRPTSSIVDLNLLSADDEENDLPKLMDKEANAGLQTEGPKLPEQMSANGRALLRKHFSTSNPIELSRGHTTVAFSEPQIHAVFKTTKTTDEHTSGAIAFDEDIGLAGLGMGTISYSEASTTEFSRGARKESTSLGSQHVTVSSPGYTEGDYEPLASMQPQTERQNMVSSPPRKRRRLINRPGKTMKPAYFKRIQWTKVFVTGPLDPIHNKHKFYCQICKTNVFMYSKGAREIIRHYQSEST